MTKKRFWVVSEVFYPDATSTAYIMTRISQKLAEYAEVHVLCGPNGYGNIVNSNQKLENIFIHRLHFFNFDKNNAVLRLLRVLFLSFWMFFFGLAHIRKTDRVFLVTNPALCIPLFAFLKRIKKFRFSILVHDVFPENLIPAGLVKSTGNKFYKLLKKVFDWSYKQADKILVLGRDMLNVIALKVNRSDNIEIVENWADTTNVQPTEFSKNDIILKHKLENKIVFLFAGNIGRLQGLEFIVELLSEITNSEIHFLFIGDGAMLQSLVRKKKERGLKNLTFLGSFPRDDQQAFLNACHFGVVTLEESLLGLGVPSKSYNILAAGKPIFFLGNQESEIAILLKETNCGVTFAQKDKDAILNFLNELTLEKIELYKQTGVQARSIAEKRYSEEIILEKFKEILV